jgi:hypothetical protein
MGAADIGKDAWNSLTGNIESAYIVVHDYRKAAARAADVASPGGIDAIVVSGGGGSGPVDKYFRVQYNPSELEVNASAPTKDKKDTRAADAASDASAASTTVKDVPVAGKLELSAVLWFDKMKPATSFMMGKDTSLFGGIRGAGNLLQDEDSVQTEVEGFIAIMRNPRTQIVTFYWADFSFTGSLINVGAQYTMFSSSGRPVRAKVSIRVRQEVDKRYAAGFFNDFETAFSGSQSNLTQPEQKVSSLFNLNL